MKYYEVKTIRLPAIRNRHFAHSRKLREYGFNDPSIENIKSVKKDGISYSTFNVFHDRILLDDGWEIIGHADFTADEPLFTFSPMHSLAPDLLPAFSFCDHCQSRDAKETYLVSKDSMVRQIKRNCLKDLSDKWIDLLLLFHTITLFDEEIDNGWIGMPHIYELPVYLGIVSEIVAKKGFISAKKAWAAIEDKAPTKTIALELYNQDHIPLDEHLLKAQEAIQYFSTLTDEGITSSFMRNVSKIATEGAFLEKEAGYAANIIPLFDKEQNNKETKNSQFLGTIGQSDMLWGRLDSVKVIYNAFGNSLLHKFISSRGDVIIWYCSGRPLGAQSGQMCYFTAKVKAHKTFRGVKQTIVTHVKLHGAK